jgi:hypothetical protein
MRRFGTSALKLISILSGFIRAALKKTAPIPDRRLATGEISETV